MSSIFGRIPTLSMQFCTYLALLFAVALANKNCIITKSLGNHARYNVHGSLITVYPFTHNVNG